MSPHIQHPSAVRRASFGTAALLALAAAGPAAAARPPLINVATASKAAPPAAGTVYGGNTAQDAPFGIRVKRGGAALSQLLLHFRAKCEDGDGLTWSGVADFASIQPPTVDAGENIFAPAKLSRTGSFKASGLGLSGFGENLRGIVKESIRGQVRGANAHGSLDATVDLFGPDGAKVTSCRTGSQRWAAKSAPSRTYAGLTSDRRPVVVELARDGRSVKDFRLSWFAGCQPSGGLSIGDHLGGFRVSPSGRFGDTFSQEYPLEAGAKTSYAYTLEGDAGGSKASGTFQVKTTETDAGGTTTASCDSTLLRWTAASSRGPVPRAVKRKLRQIRAES